MSSVLALGRPGRAQQTVCLNAALATLLLSLVVLAAPPRQASAAQPITIVSPTTDQVLSGSTLVVAASAAGANSASFSIANGGSGTLSFDPTSGLWRASVDLSSVPGGIHNVSVTGMFSGSAASDTAWRVSFPANATPSTSIGPPSITIRNPLSNHAYSGTITVQAQALNAGSVTYSVDGSAQTAMAYNAGSGLWEASLNTTTLTNASHNVDVINTGPGGASASDRAWSVAINNSAGVTPVPTPTPAPAPQSSTAGHSFGVNYSGAEFGKVVGTLGTDYIYPADPARDSYFAGKGLRLVRLPISWERLQRQPYAPLSAADLAGVRSVLDDSAAAGQKVIIDLHNFGRYYGTPLSVTDSPKLANFWQQLAAALRGHPALYGYELMNEPHDLPEGATGWAAIAQAATNAVRQSDTAAWVLLPGYAWQNATYWSSNNPTLAIHDPANHLQYSAHLYFDSDFSGQYTTSYDASGAYPNIGADRVQPFLQWLTANNTNGMLTEYGVPNTDARWLTVLDNFLSAISQNPRIAGGTYWSAGPWWGTYPLSVEPQNGHDRPQMAVLVRYPSE